MNLRHKNLNTVLILTLLFILFVPVLFPSLHLLYFTPLLVIAIYQKPLTKCLWIAFFCGVVMDFFSDAERIGFYPMIYCFSTWVLYPQKKHFFADTLSTLPLMTFFFASLSSLLELTYLSFVGHLPFVSLQWLFTDIVIMPAIDAVYAFGIFIVPFLIFGKRQRKGTDYFMSND